MAAEASRSATGSADSYLGSLISLTSKSEIRYEGILFNINTDEASIGLRNVRSFGTEGRRKDGQQVPASDKVYEYIVFRGSDIKDLQVKSSPPVQTAPPVPSDPAIIQSHYTAPTASSNLPTASIPAAAGSLPDFSNQVSQPGVPITTYQNSIPVYPPGGNMAPWNPSIPPTTNVNGISVPMYYQGYYGPSGSQQIPQPQQLQQPLLRPVQGFSMPPSMQPLSAQQSNQYPTMSSSLPTGASNIPASQSVEFPPPLLQPIVNNTLSMQCNVRPDQSSTLAADSSTNRMPSLVPAQALPSQSTNSPLVPPVISNVLDKSTVGPLIPNQAKPMSTTTTTMPFSSFSESLSAAGGKSTSPALVTPGQFLQPGPTISQSAPLEQKDVEVVQVSTMVSSPQQSSISSTAANALGPADAQAPLLPLPSPSNSKINGYPSQTRYINRGGRGGRRGGNEFSRPMPNFTEDFDFEAMNEKFKKDEVWGHLGKNKAKADDNLEYQDEDDVDALPIDSKPVYKKDDFFDTLSCNALDRESRNGRTWFSDQMRLDTETFGNFPRNRGFRGGRGPGGGRSRGGYYGRGYGYGYVGRGRGQGQGQGQGQGYGNNVYRAM